MGSTTPIPTVTRFVVYVYCGNSLSLLWRGIHRKNSHSLERVSYEGECRITGLNTVSGWRSG